MAIAAEVLTRRLLRRGARYIEREPARLEVAARYHQIIVQGMFIYSLSTAKEELGQLAPSFILFLLPIFEADVP
ncbi:hypothetical protein CCE29_04375 [Lacticaseibacillus rhamnosus]|uniref:hypothetical protein n=1 Tax=Lacticaseibacillus rhamnosus TaxID=47715 RepID=UPI0001B5E563|nr:hypothetical protein [Lacticaseibacillus rhamnosus]CAR86458.1 Putative protein without homology [Lacticaseibacillus rhamnosus GG]AON62425.1 hypothetical protein BFC96_00965 [Lacticaseibacillus rhamnosus]AQG73836.1 hypothetical protein AWJ15_12955 [Lacticaseibacillus rhamnosus]AQY33823.1 hypothetical protein B4583_00460 [Lacticaseibacillus rhamnosus]ART95251.1 hypothetical protein CCE29_04375 [Lacticaseibacillus rhamnosus]